MAIDKVVSASITTDAVGPTQLNEASNYDFTGTVTGAGEKNSPCFMAAYIGSGVEISSNTWTKATFDTEVIDVGGVYDTSNRRYTPGFVGKSFISTGLWFYDASADITEVNLQFYKNGSGIGIWQSKFPTDVERHWITGNFVIDHNATDYYEVYIQASTSNGAAIEVPASSTGAGNYRNYFQGFKVLT